MEEFVIDENENIKILIAKNIIYFRKKSNLTQSELADRLNYSDKAISKWERADGTPDIFVLNKMCMIFGIDINTLTTFDSSKEALSLKTKAEKDIKYIKHKHIIITGLSVVLVWLIATICYIFPSIIANRIIEHAWLSFIIAIPVSFIVLIVFNTLWGKRWHNAFYITLLTLTTCLSLYLSVASKYMWLIFFISIPIAIMVVLWYSMKRK